MYAPGGSLAPPSNQAVPPSQPKVVKLSWKMLEKTVGDAKGANERLQRDCGRLVIKVRAAADEKLISKAKAMVALLSENISALNECQMWEQDKSGILLCRPSSKNRRSE